MEKSKYNLIIKFAKDKFQDNNSVSDAIKNYEKLLLYFESEKIVIDFDDAVFLLKNSNKINSMVQQLIKSNIDFDCDTTLSLLCAYDSVNNSSERNLSSKAKVNDDTSSKDLNSMTLYRNELSSKILTPEEEKDLFKRNEAGDESALDLIIYYNLRLVLSIANEYCRKSTIEFNDLVQEGNIGLIAAARRFDYKKGFKFSTYATYWIKKYMSSAISKQSRIIRHSTHMYENTRKVKNYIKEIFIETGIVPTDEEIAEELNMPIEKVKDIKMCDYSKVSLDEKIYSDRESSLYTLISDDTYFRDLNIDDIIRREFVEDLEKCGLTDRELEILKQRYRFYDDRQATLEELADRFGVTHQRIDQIESLALKKLRNNKLIRTYNEEIDD